MSKYFGFINGKAYDFTYKKHPNKGWYRFFLGQYEIGALYKKTFGRNSENNYTWGCILCGDNANNIIPRKVEGFKTREYAIEYLLQTHELTRHQYNDELRDKHLFQVEKSTTLNLDESETKVLLRLVSGMGLNSAEKREIQHIEPILRTALGEY